MRVRKVLDVPLPEETLTLRVGELPVRALTKRMLLLAGVNTLRDLTEVHARALEGMEGARDDVLRELRSAMLGLALRASRNPTPAAATLELLRQTRLERLAAGPRLIAALRAAGCSSVADVLEMRTEEISGVAGFGPRTARALQQMIRRLAAIPADRLRSIGGAIGGEGFPLPRVDARILCAVALADSAEEEIYGLVLGPPVRDSLLLLKRWGLLAWPIPTLEELGRAEGLTRERVRQVVARQETRLRGSGLHLPRASALAKAVVSVATGRERARASEDPQLSSAALVPVLRTLPALARLGLVQVPSPVSVASADEQFTLDMRHAFVGSSELPP